MWRGWTELEEAQTLNARIDNTEFLRYNLTQIFGGG